MLQDAKLMAFVAIRDEKQATDFYSGILGLKKVSADSFAVVFDSGGVTLRAVREGHNVRALRVHQAG
jgi:catechol-2,3-dioxygenase